MPRSKPPHVLITSVSRKAPLVRAMQAAARKLNPEIRVIGGDVDPGALSRYVADDFWLMPRTTDAELPALLAGCRARGIGTIFPTRDGELTFWARARPDFLREGIDVIVSDPEAIARCLDKLAFAEFGRARQLPVISAASRPDAIGPGPYVVKERFGAGSRGIGINLDRDAAQAHSETLEAPIFQPFVSGPEISIDGWLDAKGSVVGVVLRRREVVVAGESQVTRTFRDADLEAQAVRALAALGLRGPVVMQAILPPEGGLQIIECNPRFGGASTTAIAAGLDTLFWSLAEAHTPTFAAHFDRLRGEVRQVRVPTDIVVHDPDL